MSAIIYKILNWLFRELGIGKPSIQPHERVINPVRAAELSKSVVELHPRISKSVENKPLVVSDQVRPVFEDNVAPKPVKYIKKQLKEKHLLDPGWDKPLERDTILAWISTKPDWLERYKRVHSLRPVKYVMKSPEYQLWSAAFSDWCSFQAKTIERQAKRKFGEDLLGFNSELLSLIIMTKFNRMLDEEIAEKKRLGLIYTEDMDPYEYEAFCGRILQSAGWVAEVTTASGDQGVDVVATKAGRKVVIQAKKYTNAVGNDAVQQIFAGKTYYGAAHAVVVCTAGFTKSAQELAQKAGVHLMHHDDLHKLESKITLYI